MKKFLLLGLIFVPIYLAAQDSFILENTDWQLTKGHVATAETLLHINPVEGTFDASNVTLEEILQTAFQLPARRRIIASTTGVEDVLNELYTLRFRCPTHQLSNFHNILQTLLNLSVPLQMKAFKKKEEVQVLRQIPGKSSSLQALDLTQPIHSSTDLSVGKFEGFNMVSLVAFLENYSDKTTIDRTEVKEFVDIKLMVTEDSEIPAALKKMGLKLSKEESFATYLSVRQLN